MVVTAAGYSNTRFIRKFIICLLTKFDILCHFYNFPLFYVLFATFSLPKLFMFEKRVNEEKFGRK
jgi:hypothetical protein